MTLSKAEAVAATAIYGIVKDEHATAAFAPALKTSDQVVALIQQSRGVDKKLGLHELLWRHYLSPYVPKPVQNVQAVVDALPIENILDGHAPGFLEALVANERAIVTNQFAVYVQLSPEQRVRESMSARYEVALKSVINATLAGYFTPAYMRKQLVDVAALNHGQQLNFSWITGLPNHSGIRALESKALERVLTSLTYTTEDAQRDAAASGGTMMSHYRTQSLYGQLITNQVYTHDTFTPTFPQSTPSGNCPARGFTQKIIESVGVLLEPHTDLLLRV